MVSDVTVTIGADTTAIDLDIAEVKGRIDSVVAFWAENRRRIMLGLSAINSLMSITTRIASKMADETGRALVKVLNSLLAVVNNTVSVLVATAAAYAATGILAPIAAALAAFTAGFSVGQSVAILQTQAIVVAQMGDVRARLSSLEFQTQFRAQQLGGLP